MTHEQGFSIIDEFLKPESSEPTGEPVDLGRNFRAVARGIAGHERELAARAKQTNLAQALLCRYPVLTEAGALRLAEKGRAVT